MYYLYLYRNLKKIRDKCKTVAANCILNLIEMLIGMSSQVRKQKKQMWSAEFDAIPLVSKKSLRSSVQGRYCVSKGIRYHCIQKGINLLTLYLPTFKRQNQVIKPSEDIYIPPYMIHVFVIESLDVDKGSGGITKVSGGTWNYSFEIDLEAEYNVIPDDFRLDQQRMRLAEIELRLKALQYAGRGLTHDVYGSIINTVRKISQDRKLSDFEHALLLGMAFDWLQRLGREKERPANIAFGAYQRIYSSLGNGYHDVRATEIGYNGGPIIYDTHKTHFANDRKIFLPRITIARNVLIGERTFLEVGTGLSIGEFSWIAVGVNILKHEHKPEGGGQLSRTVDNTTFYPTKIGSYAIIGQNAKILPKVFYIGKGAVIGHSAVVTRSVGDYAIVAGNPAQMIRYNIELAERLEKNAKPYNCDNTYETSIPYKLLLQKSSNHRDVVIIGAQNPATIISAARLFKRVLCVNCCVNKVVNLIKELTKEKLFNICLQSENPFLTHELNYRKGFVLIWLSEDKNLLSLETEIFKTIAKYSEVILIANKIKALTPFLKLRSLKPDPHFKSNYYMLFSRN